MAKVTQRQIDQEINEALGPSDDWSDYLYNTCMLLRTIEQQIDYMSGFQSDDKLSQRLRDCAENLSEAAHAINRIGKVTMAHEVLRATREEQGQ